MKYMLQTAVAAGCCWLAIFSTAAAQQRQSASPREAVNAAFARSGPQIGEMLPDVEAYDADGGKFRLSSLRGRYTVLVFGCLT